MKKDSLWNESPAGDFPSLAGEVNVDALIVGGGITGITTAYLLKQAGCRVAVIDQQSIGGGETAHTTAHLTYVTDTRLHELARSPGTDAARAFWESGQAAIQQIRTLVGELDIECGFREVPAYLYAAVESDAEQEKSSLEEDCRLASEFDFDVTLLQKDPLFGRPAVRFANQAKFHPLRYLKALAKAIPGGGSHVFSKTSAANLNPEKRELHVKGGVLRYDILIAATHVPIQGEVGTLSAALFQTKLAGYSSYAISARVPHIAESLYWDTKDPYHYWRFDNDDEEHSVVILGGEDHKTGQHPNPEECYGHLETLLKSKFSKAKITHRWSGQVIETPDGLPYIGEVAERQFLATGFSGNGMTLGTVSAMIIRDLVGGTPNPWSELFDPHRKLLSSLPAYLGENKDFPLRFVTDWLKPATREIKEVRRASGDIVRIGGKKCAVYCDEHGKRTILSAVCPHMGCIVAWNAAEKTWDCPCHGSRFMATGELIAGPAESGLEKAGE